MYASCMKRVLDFLVSGVLILILSPLLLLLALLGALVLRGNPFFLQTRPGKDERLFRLLKFRTMTGGTDASGTPLPDEVRLTRYGRFLRLTSLDELPELFNILKGDMSLVGPRPLLTEYLPYYTEREHHRHDVRPGLTGLAQVSGRNTLTWEEKFSYDLQYCRKITFAGDLKILLKTVRKVFRHDDVRMGNQHIVGRLDRERGAATTKL